MKRELAAYRKDGDSFVGSVKIPEQTYLRYFGAKQIGCMPISEDKALQIAGLVGAEFPRGRYDFFLETFQDEK